MLSCYEIARDTIEDALYKAGVRQANERSLKKSAYSTTYIISDGDGATTQGTSSCIVLNEWQPYVEILFHNGANRPKLHDVVSQTKDKVIEELINYEQNVPEGLFDFGTPIEWEELDLTDNTATLKIKLTVKANKRK